MDAAVPVRRKGAPVRPFVWVLHVALPVLALWLLVANPDLDVRWEHHPSHFWLVLAVAGVNVYLSLRVSEAALRHTDGRLFLVSLGFMASAGFLFLHSLSTPGILVAGKNNGFVIATPIGLFIASVLAAASSFEFSTEKAAAVMKRWRLLRGALIALMVAWAAASILELQPLSSPPNEEEVRGPLVVLAAVTLALYAFATLRYYLLHRRRRSVMLIALITAFALLSEAMFVVVQARAWQLSWWEWHLLLALGFGFVAYSAQVQYRREGSTAGLFTGIAAEQTIDQVRREYGTALDSLATAMRRGEETGWTESDMAIITEGLAGRFNLTEGQTAVLRRAAEALAAERDQLRKLDALVRVGQESRVILTEDELLSHALKRISDGFGTDAVRIGLLREGRLRFPIGLGTKVMWEPANESDRARAIARALDSLEMGRVADDHVVLPLTVKGRVAGLLEVHRERGQLGDRDVAMLQAMANQLSVALENARLYGQMEGLFRTYMSPDIATALIADPSQTSLGGELVEATVLFADLRGFTPFSERSTPQEVVELINSYFSAVVPRILDLGGTVVQFVGDAIMAMFNAPVRQADHALRAARAALAMQQAIEEIAGSNPDWPRFRVGVNTGPAVVGNIGSAELRGYNATGDAVNTAARLETAAEPGTVVISGTTYGAIKDVAEVEPLGALEVKGKSRLVEAYVLVSLGSPRT
jgi:adenylate cyclase